MVRIGFAKHDQNFNTTNVFSPDNGYDYAFVNGKPFSDIIEKNSYSVRTGFHYGEGHKSNTFKASVSCSMAELKVIEQYEHIVVYNDNILVFCGFNPSINTTIVKGTGKDGTNESFVEASLSYDDYSSLLEDITFGAEVRYIGDDGIKVCDPANPSKSLVHLLLARINPNGTYNVHFGNIPEILKTTTVSYFYEDSEAEVVKVFEDVLEQAGLTYWIDSKEMYIIDVLENLQGVASNIPNIETNAKVKSKPYIDTRIPRINIAQASVKEDVVVYDSGEVTVSGKTFSGVTYYPSSSTLCEVSYNYKTEDDKEKVKLYYNFTEKEFRGTTTWISGYNWGCHLDSFSRDDKGLKYRVYNDAITKQKFAIRQKSDVILFSYRQGFTPSEYWDSKEKDCDYVFSSDMAQRYANALLYDKKSQMHDIEFWAENPADKPDGYELNSVVSLQGTDFENPLFLIISRTNDLNEAFRGFKYKAIPYDREGVVLDASYEASRETIVEVSNDFTVDLSRSVIECDSAGNPTEPSDVILTITPSDIFAVPVVSVNGMTVEVTRKTIDVEYEGGIGKSDTDQFVASIPASLYGRDIAVVIVSVGDNSKNYTLSKLKPADSSPYKVEYALADDNTFYPADGYLALSDELVLRYNDIDLVYEIYENSQIQQVGTYVWMRTENADGSFTYACQTGKIEDARVFTVSADTGSVILDRRSSNSNTITFTVLTQGYRSANPVLTVNGEPVAITWNLKHDIGKSVVVIPQRTATAINAVLSESILGLETSLQIPLIDKTSDFEYLGISSTLPTGINIKGDSFVLRDSDNNLSIMVYDNGWKTLAESSLTNAEKSRICGVCQKDVLDNIETGTVTSSEYGYFRTIISEVVSADYIRAMEGLFNNIVITGNSYFYGKFNCPTIESLPNTSGTSDVIWTFHSLTTVKDSSVFDMVDGFWTSSRLKDSEIIYASSSNLEVMYIGTVSDITTIRKEITQGQHTTVRYYFDSKTASDAGRYISISKTIYSDGRTSDYTCNMNGTISFKMGQSDILKLKGLQSNSAGLQSEQIYYTTMNGHKVLCLV